jgi:glycosyltransferase involved in cell wall biosynthesis
MNNLHKVLYIYPWATFGGVERVLLNRALAFKNHGLGVRQDVCFLHKSNTWNIYAQSIEKLALSEFLRIIEKPNFNDYDCILIIDAPEAFVGIGEHHPVFVECHTPYPENRIYLKKIPSIVKGIIVPSDYFGNQIKQEVSEPFRNKILRLRNCVPDAERVNPGEIPSGVSFFNKRPIVYIGRTDYNKNTVEVIRIFANLRKYSGDDFLLIIAGPVAPGIDLVDEARRHRILDRFVLIPPVPFQSVSPLLNLIRVHKGVFISASKGESFGLSVVEAMVHEIPVVLSDRHAHLVDQHSEFLYRLGDLDSAVSRIKAILENYEQAVKAIIEIKSLYQENSFIEDWEKIFCPVNFPVIK